MESKIELVENNITNYGFGGAGGYCVVKFNNSENDKRVKKCEWCNDLPYLFEETGGGAVYTCFCGRKVIPPSNHKLIKEREKIFYKTYNIQRPFKDELNDYLEDLDILKIFEMI